MRKSRFFSICLPGLLFVTCSLYAQPASYSPEIQERINQVENGLSGWVQTPDSSLTWTLAERMKLYNVQGISIAVINDYKIEWAKGYGWADSSEHRPVTVETLFQAASISKSLNGIGVLKLAQDKRVNLDSDINQYLKTWKFPYDSISKNKKVTLSNLLSHTAGLNVHGFPGYSNGSKLPTITEILDGRNPANTVAVRSQFEPGKKFQYSGGGVTVSQVIVGDVTNQPYPEFMWQNVLKPMGMLHSFYGQPTESQKSMVATAYRSDGKEVKGRYHIYPEQAAAGMWTNPTDLCRYIIETQLSYHGKSGKVLTPEMTKFRLTPYIDISSAMGVFIDKKGPATYFHHEGGNEGFACIYSGSLDEGKGVAVMLNNDNGLIMFEILNSVANAYHWKEFYKPVIKKVIPVPDSVLSSYTGKYVLNGEKITFSKVENDLKANYRNMWWKAYFTSDTDFFFPEYRADFRFKKDPEGKVTGFTVAGFVTAKKVE